MGSFHLNQQDAAILLVSGQQNGDVGGAFRDD